MKSLRDYSLNITEEEYHALPVWSHSMIARYAREGFSSLATLHEKEAPTTAMEFGSLFDMIITQGTKVAEDNYVVYDRPVPAAERKVLDELHRIYTAKIFSKVPMNIVLTAADSVNYQPNYKPETRYNKVSVYSDYYETISCGKKVISSKDWEDAMDMTYELRSNPYTGKLFGLEDKDGIEYIYQAKFVVNYTLESGRQVQIKFMPDLLVVNHNEKTIQPVDLKTSSMPAYDFGQNFLKYRYDIQAMMYADGLSSLIQHKAFEYCGYLVLPYVFSDISRSDKQPVSWTYDQTDPSQFEGLSFTKGDKTYTYKKWDVLLDEILDYEANPTKVPKYIETDKPNNILDALGR